MVIANPPADVLQTAFAESPLSMEAFSEYALDDDITLSVARVDCADAGFNPTQAPLCFDILVTNSAQQERTAGFDLVFEQQTSSGGDRAEPEYQVLLVQPIEATVQTGGHLIARQRIEVPTDESFNQLRVDLNSPWDGVLAEIVLDEAALALAFAN